MKYLVSFFLSFILISCSSNQLVSQNTEDDFLDLSSSQIAVIGVVNELEQPEWKDQRIGLGLQTILSQQLYESGHFKMLEDKPEMKEKLQVIGEGLWSKTGSTDDNVKNAAQLGADFAVYGKVIYYGKPRSKASFAGMSVNKKTTVIKVEVHFVNTKTGKTITEYGEGESSTTATAIVFQFNDKKVDFDKTEVGSATKKALNDAVIKVQDKVMGQLVKKYN